MVMVRLRVEAKGKRFFVVAEAERLDEFKELHGFACKVAEVYI